jgi:hypothetical protein
MRGRKAPERLGQAGEPMTVGDKVRVRDGKNAPPGGDFPVPKTKSSTFVLCVLAYKKNEVTNSQRENE